MRKIVAYLILLLAFTLVASIVHAQDAQEITKWLKNNPDIDYIEKLPPDTLLIVAQEGGHFKTLGALVAQAKKSASDGGVPLAATAGDGPYARKFMRLIGAPIIIIPLQNARMAITAVIGGHVEAAIVPKNEVFPHVEAGRVRILAVVDFK